jgi:drug/metabolite transporter (DMT)-like permease
MERDGRSVSTVRDGSADAHEAGGQRLEAVRVQRQLSFARRGLFWGLLSGITWGLVGVLLGVALGLPPFSNVRPHSAALWGLLAAPLVGACLHDSFAALWIVAYNVSTGRAKEYARTIKTVPGAMICIGGIFGGPMFMSGYLIAIRLSGAFYALAITATYPIIGALLAALVLKEKTGPRLWLGIVLCIVGAIAVGYVPPGNNANPYFYVGLGAALVATIGVALEGIFSTMGMDLVDSNIAMGIRELTSSVIYLAIILPLLSASGILAAAVGHKSFLILAVAGVIGGYSFQIWYRGFNMAGVSRTMALNITYALWGLLFGWAFTGATVTATLLVGAMLITVGAIITVLSPQEFLVLRKVELDEAAP